MLLSGVMVVSHVQCCLLIRGYMKILFNFSVLCDGGKCAFFRSQCEMEQVVVYMLRCCNMLNAAIVLIQEHFNEIVPFIARDIVLIAHIWVH